MKPTIVLAVAAASLLATPLFAGSPAKRPSCQVSKTPARDAKRLEFCRKQAIPPVIDPTPMFLASTAASPSSLSVLS